MSSRHNEALLLKAPTDRHFCQIHQDPAELARAVALFAGTGLQRGDGVVIVATPEHRAEFVAELNRMDIDTARHVEARDLVLLDAQDTLDQLMHGGMPDWNRFQRTIGPVIDESNATHRGVTRAYGEMVSLLWRRGECSAAIKLEEYWNELIRLNPLTLFCAYMLDGLEPESYHGPLNEIGRTHTDVLGTDDDERLRAAIDEATEEILGISFSLTLSFSGREQTPGEHRLPIGRRTMLWLQRNMPASSRLILERARHYYELGQANGWVSALKIN